MTSVSQKFKSVEKIIDQFMKQVHAMIDYDFNPERFSSQCGSLYMGHIRVLVRAPVMFNVPFNIPVRNIDDWHMLSINKVTASALINVNAYITVNIEAKTCQMTVLPNHLNAGRYNKLEQVDFDVKQIKINNERFPLNDEINRLDALKDRYLVSEIEPARGSTTTLDIQAPELLKSPIKCF